MSLLNSQFTYYDLQGADPQAFRQEVDRLAKEADDSLQTTSGPASKRARTSQSQTQDSGFASPDASVSLPDWTSVSGTVIKLTLENFLCHEYLEVDFNSKINFIVGRNGSGKSAILTALVVALGGSAATTGRGTSLKDFIRNGTSSARVTCVINNAGHLRYKPHEYGTKIVIVRTLQQSGGSVAMKSDKGKKLASTMDELRTMTLTLGIQVDNPISVLDQNTARHFLNMSSPAKKFELFMKATNLESLQRLYADVTRTTRGIEQEISAKETQLEENSAEVKEAERKYKMAQNLECDRENKTLLDHEYLWATYRDNVKAAEKVVNSLHKVEDEKERLSQMVSGGGAEEAILQEIENLEKEIKIYDTQESEKENEVTRVKEGGQGIQLQRKQCSQEKNRLMQSIKQEEENIIAYKSEIEAQQQRMMPDHLDQRRRQQDQVQALQRRLQDIRNEQSSKDMEIETVRNSLNSVTESVRSYEMSQRNLREQYGRTERDLKGLQSHSSNLAVFGPGIPEIVQKIEEAYKSGRFVKKPVGPLGAYVKVKDAKWTLAVEAVMGLRLRSFVVDNRRDEKELEAIMKRVLGRGQIPSIICTKFYDRVHDTSRTRAQSNQYSSVLEMTEISHPVASNLLIDLCNIETTLLIPTDKECQQALSEQRNVPRNCRRAFTVDGDSYFPAPSFKTYAGQLKKARFLQASREDAIRAAQARLTELENSIRVDKEMLTDLKKQEAEQKIQIQQLYAMKRQLQNESVEISEALEQVKDQEQPDLNTVSTLRKELEEKEELVQDKKKEIEEIDAKLQELQKKIDETNIKYRKCMKDIETIRKQRKPLREKVNGCKEQLRELKSTQASTKRNLENLKRQEAELLKEKEEFEAKCVSSKEEAERFEAHLKQMFADKNKEFQSRSDTTRSSIKVEQELRSLTKKLESVERALGGNEQNIMDDFLEKSHIYNETKDYIERLQKNVNYMNKAIQIRRALYHTQKQLMCAVVSHQFTRVLRFRNHVGSLKFNPEKGTLTIESGPMDGTNRAGLGTSSLSGGERSYTTMAFVIALWNVTELPFYFMDEFDVFMDHLNRQTVLKLMLRFAKQKKWFQFGFLTPLDTTAVIADEDVTIHKLDDPRR